MGAATVYEPRRWLMLSVIIMAMVRLVLDTFIVNVALTSISQTLLPTAAADHAHRGHLRADRLPGGPASPCCRRFILRRGRPEAETR